MSEPEQLGCEAGPRKNSAEFYVWGQIIPNAFLCPMLLRESIGQGDF